MKMTARFLHVSCLHVPSCRLPSIAQRATIPVAAPMSNGEIDISWQALRRIVQEWAGTSVELVEFIPLHGGQINTTLELHLSDGKKVALKVSPHRVDRAYE